jgi:3-keto-disaccharide hydrolase
MRRVLVVVLWSGLMTLASLSSEAASAPAPSPSPSVWGVSLFNGRDLSGWDTWLGIPHASVTGLDLPKDEAGKYTAAQGLNTDPKHVFTVVTVDGAPAIRISGEMFGALTSREEYGDFHLRLEFKWGEKKWPPKENAARDSGILYDAVGEPGAADNKAWMRSLECQVQEHDTGDFWGVGGTFADVAGDAEGEGKDRKVVHRPGAPVVTVGASPRRAIKALDNENPTGEWNTVEVLCLRGTCRHVVNGKTNLVLTNPRQAAPDGALVPLTKGRLQIQSEGAEVFYRNIQVRSISEWPAGF